MVSEYKISINSNNNNSYVYQKKKKALVDREYVTRRQSSVKAKHIFKRIWLKDEVISNSQIIAFWNWEQYERPKHVTLVIWKCNTSYSLP